VVSGGAYVAGALELVVVVVALALAAARIRTRLIPGWEGAPGRLAEAVLGLALLVWVGELLGAVGLFREGALVIACVAVAIGVRLLVGPPPAPVSAPRPPVPDTHPLELLVAVGIAALLFAHWGFETQEVLNNGISNFDTLWYHLPFATNFAQSSSVTGLHFTDPLFLNWFYPQNSELLHGVAILLTGRDTLSLFVNLGWLGLALLAAWCVGRPYGRGALTLAGAAILLESHALVVREPGSAKNDIVGIALVLASVALLVNWWAASGPRPSASGRQSSTMMRGGSLAPLGLAGLAAGLAAGTKLTVLALVAALTLAVIATAPAGLRRRAAAFWLTPLLAGGGFWYARNLILSANPLPWVRELGPLTLPGPERLQEARPELTVAHYATDTDVWTAWFTPGLHDAFGFLWPLVLAGGVAGALAVCRRRERGLIALGLVALFGMAAYLFTPLSAAGEEGRPLGFAINLRFLIPSLIVGLTLLGLAPGLDRGPRRWALLGALVAVLIVTDRSDQVLRAPERAAGATIAIAAVLLPAALWALRRRGLGAAAFAGGLAALAAVALAVGYPVQRSYLEDRFESFDGGMHLDSAYRWAGGVSDARIALAGTTAGFLEYGFFGKDLSNTVRYLGRHGPKGAFSAIPDCAGFRRTLNAGDFDYLVTAPFLDFAHPGEARFSPEAGWVAGEPAVRPISRDGRGIERVTVWRIRGRVDVSSCNRVARPVYVPGPRRN
jgi:hypothetical protein